MLLLVSILVAGFCGEVVWQLLNYGAQNGWPLRVILSGTFLVCFTGLFALAVYWRLSLI